MTIYPAYPGDISLTTYNYVLDRTRNETSISNLLHRANDDIPSPFDSNGTMPLKLMPYNFHQIYQYEDSVRLYIASMKGNLSWRTWRQGLDALRFFVYHWERVNTCFLIWGGPDERRQFELLAIGWLGSL